MQKKIKNMKITPSPETFSVQYFLSINYAYMYFSS